MKKNLIFYITIFIFVFSASFFLSDRVSFAADSDSGVKYEYETSDGQHGSKMVKSGTVPFILNSEFPNYSHSNKTWYKNLFVYVAADGGYDWKIDGVKFSTVQLWSPNNVQFTSVSPSVPVLSKQFYSSSNEPEQYAAQYVKDPSLLPINVTTYDSSLGSLQLKDSTSWRLLRYEPIDDEPASLPNIFKVKLRAEFQDTTSTGESYDKIQVMVRVKNIRSQFLASNTYPWKNKFSKDEYYSYYLPDLKSPTTVDLQTHDYTKREEDGHINFNISYPIFQPCIDHFALTKPIFANDDWFLCDYTICYRPVTTDGKFGDWFYITPDHDFLGHNIDGNSSSISASTGTSLSDADPNSLSFNSLPEDSTSSRTAIGKGSTLENAIANSNNSLVGGGITSGGSLTSNITDLFSFFSNLPLIISTVFGWLPPWVLSLFAIGFALFVPIFIYKFVRG